MFKQIGEAIETKLNGLMATTTLNAVFNYEAKSSDSRPYATIVPSPSTEFILDNQSDELNISYLVKIFDESSDDLPGSTSNLRELVDDILEAFRIDYTLGGLSKNFSVDISFTTTDDDIPKIFAEIVFTYQTLESILP